MDLRQKIFKYRSYTPIPFLLAMIVWAHPSAAGMVAGFCVVIAGELIRLWGVAFAGSETRTTGPVGGTYLITRGPFAYVRNPLYVGNILMYSGVGIMAGVLWLVVLAIIYFTWQYSMIVSLEEEYLFRTFGERFTDYYKSVPRFFPVFRKYPETGASQPECDWKSGLRSERRTLQAIGLLAVILIVLWYVRN